MAKRAGAYKSEKRKKEVMRQKKQEAKRHRRATGTGSEADEGMPAEGSLEAGQEPASESADVPAEAQTETKE
ncbi:MAG: hypothetical protein EPN25_10150 [Nitrospirae bacterium]|nr:MAG: hypothetical protein EPN25_10150 [Nitrospirota bacterium]